MATAAQAQVPTQATPIARVRRGSLNRDRVLARALLSPSVIATFVFDKMFGAQQYNLGAAASVVMLVLVSIVIVPYLARQLKEL